MNTDQPQLVTQLNPTLAAGRGTQTGEDSYWPIIIITGYVACRGSDIKLVVYSWPAVLPVMTSTLLRSGLARMDGAVSLWFNCAWKDSSWMLIKFEHQSHLVTELNPTLAACCWTWTGENNIIILGMQHVETVTVSW